jgi:hypothetical protein
MTKLNRELRKMPDVNVTDSKAAVSKVVEAGETASEIGAIHDCITAAEFASFNTPPANFRIGIAKGRFMAPDDIDTDNEAVEKLFIE